MKTTKVILVALFICCISTTQSLATNGMFMEGYGPISHAMGGTSMAFDNGNNALVNNPATLGLASAGSRIDVGFSILNPDVTWQTPGGNISSNAKRFFMPSFGYVKRNGNFGYGIGMYSQGGMGTDYLEAAGMYSQVIMAKVIAPFTYNINKNLIVGAAIEYIKIDMDLVMYPFFDFKDKSDFSGATSGNSITGKLGFVYKINNNINVGANYQFKGNIDTLKQSNSARVKGLDTPASASIGIAAKINDKTLLALDYSRIMWSDSMKTITVSQNDATMPFTQEWKDQDVFALGVEYEALSKLKLRAGVNIANNPIKDNATPVFPAIIKNAYTTGFGYDISKGQSVNASYSFSPEVKKNNGLLFDGTSTTHRQHTIQLMYTYKF